MTPRRIAIAALLALALTALTLSMLDRASSAATDCAR